MIELTLKCDRRGCLSRMVMVRLLGSEQRGSVDASVSVSVAAQGWCVRDGMLLCPACSGMTGEDWE